MFLKQIQLSKTTPSLLQTECSSDFTVLAHQSQQQMLHSILKAEDLCFKDLEKQMRWKAHSN